MRDESLKMFVCELSVTSLIRFSERYLNFVVFFFVFVYCFDYVGQYHVDM